MAPSSIDTEPPLSVVGDPADRPSATPGIVSSGAGRRRFAARLPDGRATRFAGLVGLYAVLATLATVTSSPGRWIADARLEYSTDPTGFLLGHAQLWDATRGMGNTSTFFTPVLAAYQSLLETLGAEPWLIERLVHATYLTLAAAGAAAVAGLGASRVGRFQLLAGLVYAFNPYTSQFLVPSGLFVSYALAPWLLYFTVRGLRDPQGPSRFAAWFALAVFVVGALNTAALVYGALVVPICILYLLLVERSVRVRRVVQFVAWVTGLTLVVSASTIVVLWYQLGDISLNLATTERPEVVSGRSSFAESWRGLGMWLTYFRDASGQLRPQAAPYFENAAVIVASFAAPIAAGIALVLSRWRRRWLFGCFVAIGIVALVGIWPPSDPTPLGRLLGYALDSAGFLRGFRTTYKAGAVFYLGLAVLAAHCVVVALSATPSTRGLGPWSPRWRTWIVRASGFGLVAGMTLAAAPFWTGSLYAERDSFRSIPEYWDDALDWLDDQPDDSRVLVLPGVIRTRYRWGYVNDNLFHGLLDRSVVMHQSIPPPGTPLAADAALAIEQYLIGDDYRDGTIAPLLRRLGVRHVLIQNDLDWEQIGVPRPGDLAHIRADPGLELVAGFGRAGENTTAGDDPAAELFGEEQLRPVEIYELEDPGSVVRAAPSVELLVSGAGDSWPQLARQGRLERGPIRYTGDIADEDLAAAIDNGSEIVISDGNRRRYVQARTGRLDTSHTLAVGERSSRAALDLFDGPASQTVATYRDAVVIDASRTGNGTMPFDASIRPSNAFDGTTSSAWRVRGAEAVGSSVRAQLRRPTDISTIEIETVNGAVGRSISGLRVGLVDRDGVVSSFDAIVDPDAPTRFSFPVRSDAIVELHVEILSTSGPVTDDVGLADIAIETPSDGPLDLREFLRVPRDLELALERSPELEPHVAQAPVEYSFQRWTGDGEQDEEIAVRRTFWSPGRNGVSVHGTLQVGPETPDRTVDALLGRETGAFGSASPDEAGGWGVNAIDGDEATAWIGRAEVGESLTVRPPAEEIGSVSFAAVVIDEGVPRSTIERASIRADGPAGPFETGVRIGRLSCTTEGSERCVQRISASMPRGVYDSIVLDITEVEMSFGSLGRRGVAISEVLLDGGDVAWPSDTEDVDRCVDGVVLDEEVHEIRLAGRHADLLDGTPIRFESCGAGLTLERGVHRLATSPALDGAVSDLELTPLASGDRPVGASSDDLEVLGTSSSHLQVRLSSRDGDILIGPGSFHPGWSATVDGRALDPAIAVDGQSGWRLPDLDDAVVELRFAPQRTYELAMAMTAAGLAMCLVLILRRSRS